MDDIKGKAFVIDNFLDKFDAEVLEQEMYDWDTFPWYCVPRNVAGMNADVDPVHDVYFKHDFFFNAYGVSSSIDIVKPIIKKLVPLSLVRIRANLNVGGDKPFRFGFHTDFPDIATAIYYVNSNNGLTVFESGEEIESVKGRLVLFDSNLTHTTQTQTDTSTRMLINFNYVPEAIPYTPGEGTYGRQHY